MEEKYLWNLKDIFESDDKCLESVEDVYKILDEIKKYKGNLNTSDNIFEMYRLYEQILIHIEKIFGYAMLRYNQDMSNIESMKLYKKAEKLLTESSEIVSFIAPELSELSEDMLNALINEERFAPYKRELEDIIKQKKHILSKEIEEVLAKYADTFNVSENTFDILTNTEFEFPKAEDKDGNLREMSEGLFGKYLKGTDEVLRKNAYNSIYSLYKKHINSISELYLGRVKTRVTTSKLRNYESSLDAATDADDSNIKVYEALIKSVNENLYINHEYMKLKAKLLGKEKIHSYDMSVNVLDKDDPSIEYEDAKLMVLDALKPMGEDYVESLKFAFDNRWLDVYERKNKMTGGYNMGVYGVHPYILLNYVKSLRDVSTIAHELGHAMHSNYSSSNQNVFNSQYTIMVAEVASTVNEILLARYLIDKETDSKKKAALIQEQLDLIRATLIEQTKLAEFEENVHKKVEAGETLTSENLNEIFFGLVKKYAGEALEAEEESKYVWARIPHFYRCFYVYKYATGITAAIVIANKILSGEEGYVDRYKEMLKQGRSKTSIELLRMVDVDLESEETYNDAFRYYENLLKNLKELLK